MPFCWSYQLLEKLAIESTETTALVVRGAIWSNLQWEPSASPAELLAIYRRSRKHDFPLADESNA